MFKKIDIVSLLSAIFVNVLVAGVIVFAVSTWQGPPTSPPAGPPPDCPAGTQGCDPPVNVGSAAQVKGGALGVNGVFQAFSNVVLPTAANSISGAGVGSGLNADLLDNKSSEWFSLTKNVHDTIEAWWSLVQPAMYCSPTFDARYVRFRGYKRGGWPFVVIQATGQTYSSAYHVRAQFDIVNSALPYPPTVVKALWAPAWGTPWAPAGAQYTSGQQVQNTIYIGDVVAPDQTFYIMVRGCGGNQNAPVSGQPTNNAGTITYDIGYSLDP